jgi:hypothetical protein
MADIEDLVSSKPHICTAARMHPDRKCDMHEEGLGRTSSIPVSKLALQTTQVVQQSQDPLAFLAAVTGRFPAVARSISNITVATGIRSALQQLSAMLPPGHEFLLVNGVRVRCSSVGARDVTFTVPTTFCTIIYCFLSVSSVN